MRSGGFRLRLEFLALILLASFLVTVPLMWAVTSAEPELASFVGRSLLVLFVIGFWAQKRRSRIERENGYEPSLGWENLLFIESGIAIFWFGFFKMMRM